MKRKKATKLQSIRPIAIKSDGTMWDIEASMNVSCLLGEYDCCFGHCQWLSVDDDGTAKCQQMVIGKVAAGQ